MRVYWRAGALALTGTCLAVVAARGDGDSFVNWENPHVHPMDLTSDGHWLLAVNTADARLEVLDLSSGWPVHAGSVSVGLDPVSVRSRGNAEAWVVNHISDSVSVVDLTTLSVVATLATADEPADVIFAGQPERAYVSCSQVNLVQVFDPAAPAGPISSIEIDGEDPRAMAVSPDGGTVYVAIFESGNATTLLSHDNRLGFATPVSDPEGPWGGQNPPPNADTGFEPPINPELPPPPPVSLIVKRMPDGRWLDDNQGDWTDFVSGPLADRSDRPQGWDMLDHDVAMIDTVTQQVEYATGLMNLCMALSVNPATGKVTVVGTDAINHIRYEPVLSGRFLRVNVGLLDPASPEASVIRDLNPHLDYTTSIVEQPERDRSIGDPRGVVWNAVGTRGYVSGMGSSNVIAIDADGHRIGQEPIPVGQGPTGLVLDESRGRLYVLNRFEASVSVLDALEPVEYGRVWFFDPTPQTIKDGRPHLYDTHETSGLGHVSCGSCHVDGRIDRLAWDLGNPAGEMRAFNQNCLAGILEALGDGLCSDWHPMKGPMTTQTLQDIIGKEPLHWRGDRDGLEEFNGAFQSLMGDDEMLSPEEMQEFEDFLATLTFPPNPFRELDNTLPTSLPLPGHVSVGKFSPAGTPLPPGNAVQGLDAFRTGRLPRIGECVTCHTLPTGTSTNMHRDRFRFEPVPPGPNGELHHALRPVNETNLKPPQLRSVYDKLGADQLGTRSRAGFGLLHDGNMDTLERFLSLPFNLDSDQELADVVAFLLAFAGSDVPVGTGDRAMELIGPSSRDTHAAVGVQVTLNAENLADPATAQRVDMLLAMADTGRVGLIAKGRRSGVARGWAYLGDGIFQSDRAVEQMTSAALRGTAGAGSETTFTVVVEGTQRRLGIDRDEDGHLDRDEIEGCSNPADPSSTPLTVEIIGDANANGILDLEDLAGLTGCLTGPGATAELECRCTFDLSRDGDVSLTDFAEFQGEYNGE